MLERKREIKGSKKTDTGRVRDQNEDDCCIRFVKDSRSDRVRVLVAVADGMGGGPVGELASGMAIKSLEKHFKLLGKVADQTHEYLSAVMEWAFNEATQVIYQASREDTRYDGMGTTLTAAFVKDDLAIIGHAGDSRAYLIRDGEIRQLTDDHSLVAEQVRDGTITPEEARTSPDRSIVTRSIGTDPKVSPDIYQQKLKEGDVLLLCTDGLTDLVRDEEILAVALNTKSVEQACDNLVALANQRGGHDNVTVVGLEIGELLRYAIHQKHASTTPVKPRRSARKLLVILFAVVFLLLLTLGTCSIKRKLDSRKSEAIPVEKINGSEQQKDE